MTRLARPVLLPTILSAVLATAAIAELPRTPPSPTGSRIAVANRVAGTVTLIDVTSERELTMELEPGSDPMYAQNPFFSNEIWVGDRGHDRVLVYDALRFRRKAEIPVGAGVFHMWNHGGLGQMWVVGDVDKTLTVISLATKEVLATIPIPAELADAGFKPHDMTVTANAGIVSLLGAGTPDGWLIKYSGTTFEETARLRVPGDPHLFYWGFEESRLYVASQAGGKVLELDPETLAITGELDIPGAHGIWADETETFLYVGNITSTDGEAAIYTIDIETFSIVPGSPTAAALPHPHNFMVSIDNTKLFVTHSNSGSSFTSIYDLDETGIPVASRVVETGDIPFGIMLIRDPLGDLALEDLRFSVRDPASQEEMAVLRPGDPLVVDQGQDVLLRAFLPANTSTRQQRSYLGAQFKLESGSENVRLTGQDAARGRAVVEATTAGEAVLSYRLNGQGVLGAMGLVMVEVR